MYRRKHQPQHSNQSSDKPKNEHKKIINVLSDTEMFLNICEAFEIALNDLKLKDQDEYLNTKLLKIQGLIQRKTQLFKHNTTKRSKSTDLTSKKLGGLQLPELLMSSTSSLCSKASVSAIALDDELAYKDFLSKVNCPFCFESQTDKISLIKHFDEKCRSLMNKVFPANTVTPYSVFQILPNNTFKCNVCVHSFQKDIKHYFIHAKTRVHISAYNAAIKKKDFSNFFFCSCCKVLVPDNYTQYTFHISHEIHNTKRNLETSTSLLQQETCVLYKLNKKFKCLICVSSNIFKNSKEMLLHLQSSTHLSYENKLNKKFFWMYCEFCNKKINVSEVLIHLTSKEHATKEKEVDPKESFEMCFYCGFTCKNLKELAPHIEEKCEVINELKKQIPKEKKPSDSKKNSFDVKMDEDNKNDKDFIIIKDNTDVIGLFKYFQKFGEITSVEPHQEKNILIRFREKKTVEDILLLQNVIKINGVKLEITTDEFVVPDKRISQSDNEDRDSSSSDDHSNDSDDVSLDVSDSDDQSNFIPNKETTNELKLKQLFEKVSTHLLNNTDRLDSEVEKKIIEDCSKIPGVRKCTLTGFAGCGLYFSLESIGIYCEFLDTLKNSDSYDGRSIPSTFPFLKNLMKIYYQTLDLSLWENLFYYNQDLLYIDGTHKESQITCKITCMPFAQVLTNILRHYMEENPIVVPFCLMVRFWLRVHSLKIREFEYVIISLLVFFLLNKEIIKPFPDLEKISSETHLLSEAVKDKIGVDKFLGNKRNSKTLFVKELFFEFLLFLKKFDFKEQIICTPIKYSIPKKMLRELKFCDFLELSEKNALEKSAMCILDPFMAVNLASQIDKKDLQLLVETIKKTV